jgi:hypothetical protein
MTAMAILFMTTLDQAELVVDGVLVVLPEQPQFIQQHKITEQVVQAVLQFQVIQT